MCQHFAQLLARPAFWLLLAVLLLCTSCGGGLSEVRGKVLYQGKPIKGAVVAFHPKGDTSITAIHPTGVTDEEGNFTLSSGTQSGAPTGDYVVTIVWPETNVATKPQMGFSETPADVPDRLKGRYADQSKSRLTVVVKTGTNQLEPFDLK
jgi:hypothetical protein